MCQNHAWVSLIVVFIGYERNASPLAGVHRLRRYFSSLLGAKTAEDLLGEATKVRETEGRAVESASTNLKRLPEAAAGNAFKFDHAGSISLFTYIGSPMIIRVCLALGALSFSSASNSAEWSGFRNIVELGCMKSEGTCWVTLEGSAMTGAPGCSSPALRWDVKNDANGKNFYALFLLAQASKKRVALNVDGCYSAQPNYPTFTFGQIEP